MAPHSSTLAWKIPWMEEPGGLQSMGHSESDTTERLHFHVSLSCIGEGNGNPLPWRIPWSSRVHKESDTTEQLIHIVIFLNLSLNLAIRSSWSEPQSA